MRGMAVQIEEYETHVELKCTMWRADLLSEQGGVLGNRLLGSGYRWLIFISIELD